ncbi:MAG: patatin-like phospholipase family protein [Alphaproteobacteria bacterium]
MPDETVSRRPTIALALGGGAARGFAHIGVIRTLIAKGFKPDIIAGTSIGAVVGGCYAAGKLDEIEQWARSLTRRRLFGYLDVSLGGLGLISGSRLFESLSEAVGDVRIEALPLRFAAIATEIGTGHEIWLTRGRLVDALRASYALPGIFPAVQVGDRWLIDGALVNPVPVSAARALDARVVIAVNVNTDLFGRGTTIQDYGAAGAEPPIEEEAASHGLLGLFGAEKNARRRFFGTAGRPGLSNVMVEAFNVMQDRITRARLAGDPPDVMISPRIGRIGLFDFHRAEEAIAIGAEATEKALERFDEVVAALA